MKVGTWIAALLTAGVPLAASAQTETLDYLGSPFTNLTVSGNVADGLANAPLAMTGQVVLSAPLGDDLSNFQVTPLSWTFSGLYLSSSGPVSSQPDNFAQFSVSTDANGALTGWDVSIDAGFFDGTNAPSGTTLSLTDSGDTLVSFVSGPACAAPPGISVPCFNVSESNDAPGSWSSAATRAPEIDPGSAASAFTLLLGSLLLLRGRRPGGRPHPPHPLSP